MTASIQSHVGGFLLVGVAMPDAYAADCGANVAPDEAAVLLPQTVMDAHEEPLREQIADLEARPTAGYDPFAPHKVRIYSKKPGHAPEFWASHPADCDALPYGADCWFDDLVEVERDAFIPWTTWPDKGLYTATPPGEGEMHIRFESINEEG